MIKAADYLIDLDPGAADERGQIVLQGTPESVANNPALIAGRFLGEVLKSGPHSTP